MQVNDIVVVKKDETFIRNHGCETSIKDLIFIENAIKHTGKFGLIVRVAENTESQIQVRIDDRVNWYDSCWVSLDFTPAVGNSLRLSKDPSVYTKALHPHMIGYHSREAAKYAGQTGTYLSKEVRYPGNWQILFPDEEQIYVCRSWVSGEDYKGFCNACGGYRVHRLGCPPTSLLRKGL